MAPNRALVTITGKAGSSAPAQSAALRGPLERDTLVDQHLEVEPGRLVAGEDGLLDVGRKECQAQDTPVIRGVDRAADIMNGDLTFVVGSPETDPAGDGSSARHIGTLSAGETDRSLPDWLEALKRERKLIWVYAGNPRYGGPSYTTPFDSAVVLDAAFSTLGNIDVDVVLTMGFQSVPEGHIIPSNFHLADFLSGPAIAARCDVMIHHGGHGSMINGLAAGKPAVIVPTNSERESNARRLASLGAGEFVLPTANPGMEKHVDNTAFASAVQRVLSTRSYTEKARQLGERISRLGGVRAVVRSVEELAAA